MACCQDWAGNATGFSKRKTNERYTFMIGAHLHINTRTSCKFRTFKMVAVHHSCSSLDMCSLVVGRPCLMVLSKSRIYWKIGPNVHEKVYKHPIAIQNQYRTIILSKSQIPILSILFSFQWSGRVIPKGTARLTQIGGDLGSSGSREGASGFLDQ